MNIESFLILYKKMEKYIFQLKGRKANLYEILRYGLGFVWNYIFYEATISDYFELQFYKKKPREKKTYITSKETLRFAEYVDTPEVLALLFSKCEMYKRLSDFVKRDQLFSEECSFEDFEVFVNNHPKFLYKPDKDDCGHGIEVWDTSKGSMQEMYKKAKNIPAVLDEIIEQNSIMSALNPSSVNTIRLYTLTIGRRVIYMSGFLRMGVRNMVVDNLGAGGILAEIDVRTGRTITDGLDSVGHIYEEHPNTKIPLKNFQIPKWKSVIKFTSQCARAYEMKYVAWDIALRENDCVLIEANPNGMIHGIQMRNHGGRKAQYIRLRKKLKSQGESDNGILYT